VRPVNYKLAKKKRKPQASNLKAETENIILTEVSD